MLKSASSTTLAQGPGHAAGGVKENNFGEKSANAMFVNRDTTHGVVAGRGTGGSAVAVFADPICNPAEGICAKPLMAVRMSPNITRVMLADDENRFCLVLCSVVTTTSQKEEKKSYVEKRNASRCASVNLPSKAAGSFIADG
jgi:hypothetical protein